MITRLLKILLAASSLAYTVYLFTKAQTGAAIGMIFVTIILTLATLRSMRLVMAFVQLRQQNMDKARVWLSRVSESSLWPRQRGYYYFLMGSMTMEQNMNDAEKFIKRALQLGLKQDHDKAAANLNLAIVASTRRKLPEAKKVLCLTLRSPFIPYNCQVVIAWCKAVFSKAPYSSFFLCIKVIGPGFQCLCHLCDLFWNIILMKAFFLELMFQF